MNWSQKPLMTLSTKTLNCYSDTSNFINDVLPGTSQGCDCIKIGYGVYRGDCYKDTCNRCNKNSCDIIVHFQIFNIEYMTE